MKFNERLKQLRLENKWSQEELAKKVGVQRTTIPRYESSDPKTKIEPTLDMLLNLSNVLDCSLDYLLGKSNVKNAPDFCRIELDPDKPITVKDLERLMDYLKKKLQE